jgi:sugar phosphate isomerase/epimerase
LSAEDEELVASTRDFVSLYVLHPPGRENPAACADAWAGLVGGWRGSYGDDFLLEYTGAEAFASAEAALPGLPLCADTGCLMREGLSPAAWVAGRSSRIREIHLHGLETGKDHGPLRDGEDWLDELAPLLETHSGRVELEVFSLEGVEASWLALERTMERAMERTRGRASGVAT